KVFASQYFGIPYGAVTKAQRKFAKPPTLGCFAADTKVLTDRGWIDIVGVGKGDLLWDGEEWVTHRGVICQGEKEVVRKFGVRATMDHEILVGDLWAEWRDLD